MTLSRLKVLVGKVKYLGMLSFGAVALLIAVEFPDYGILLTILRLMVLLAIFALGTGLFLVIRLLKKR